ncbi:RNA-binding protein [Bryobacterales bacterium F-183]|nr:RNA-binding protein [Bryobacterales bacterium F-183]
MAAFAAGVTAPFTDVTSASRVTFAAEPSKTSSKYLMETMLGGVAMFDADGDGRLDLFFTNGAALRDGMTSKDRPVKTDPRFWNRLYRNEGNGKFTDITNKAGVRGEGYSQGVAVGDCDNDGLPDLLVTAYGGNTLYRNQGGAVFADITAQSGVQGSGWSTSAGFIDYDRDGNLDLFVARYLDWDFGRNKRCGGEGAELQAYCHPNEFPPVTHLLYRGLGGCKFQDVSTRSGIAKFPGKGLGVAFVDMDADGWPDILVANDSFPQQVFRNRQNGTFEETALALGAAYDEDGRVFAGMGIDAADYDNDGLPDLLINALANQGYNLFRNTKGLLESVSAPSGLYAASKMHSGWGMKFVDYDNDGWKDIFVAQGHVMDNIERTQPGTRYLETPMLLRNVRGKFVPVSSGVDVPMAARGAAFGDLNNDGSVDIAIAANSGAPRIFLSNRNEHNHWLLVDLQGTRSNRDGIGATVKIETPSGRRQFGYATTAGSYLSAHDKRLHFGLGAEREVKLLEIRWPSGTVQTWQGIPADKIFTARERTN